MKKVRTTLLWFITAAICAFVACGITTELFPQPQFTVELEEAQDQTVTVYTYHDEGTPFSCTQIGPDTYACDIPQGYWENAYHLEFTVDPANNRVLTASINGEAVRPGQIVNVGDGAFGVTVSENIICASEITTKGVLTFAFFFLLLVAVCLIIRHEVRHSGFGGLSRNLMCGGTALPYIGKKPLLWALAGVLLSCMLAVGCDIDGFIGAMNLSGSGVSIYQYQATMNMRYQISLPVFAYNLPTLLFYSLGTLPATLGRSLFVVGRYHIWHYLLYKLLNGAVLAVAIISILSFLESHGYISGKKCISAFLWAFFNPLVFYVAVIYIHLDALPMCCLAIGCLLLVEKRTPVLSGVLLAIGVSCKMQNLLNLPLVMVLLLFLILKEHTGKDIVSLLKTVASSVMTMGIFLLPNIYRGTPIETMFRYMPLTGRVWWTALQYVQGVFFYITVGSLVIVVIMDLAHVELRCSKEAMLVNTFYMFAAVVLIYSFSLLSTPSIFIQCLAAFTICYALITDNLRRFFISAMSVIIAFNEMLQKEGDILKLAHAHGFPFSFTTIAESLTAAGFPYMNFVFTISHAAMLAFGIYFCKEAISVLKSNDILRLTEE